MNSVSRLLVTGLAYAGLCVPLLLAVIVVNNIMLGETFGPAALGFLAAVLLLENLLPDYYGNHQFKQPQFFVALMYAYVMLSLTAFVLFLWVLSYHYGGGGDLLGLAAFFSQAFGVDMVAAHSDDTTRTMISHAFSLGAINAVSALAFGHELGHRTHDPVAQFLARLAGLPATFTYYAIEHPQGHHYNVGTPADSSTALRGESVYRYFVRTTPQDYREAWRIEGERLQRLGHNPLSWRNRLLQGWVAEAFLVAMIYFIAGFSGLLLFLLSALVIHFGYKMGTYAQHFGICRVPGSDVKPHHIWDCANRVDHWLTAGTCRHAHHHLNAHTGFWELEVVPASPKYRFGYVTTMLLQMIPPLWHRLITPKLLEWDSRYASPAERELAKEANYHSGVSMLMAHARASDTPASQPSEAG